MNAGFSLAGKRIWVAGHTGLVGSALVRRLVSTGAETLCVGRSACDLRDQAVVHRWVADNRPDAIFIAAGLVGGIEANRTRPAEFLYDNLLIGANIIHAAASFGVAKLMFLGSSCCYPREAAQPIHEDSLLTGPFEPTNEAYAVAKVAGIKLCQAYRRQHGHDFIAVVPTNLYGPGDNFDPAGGHVIAAMLRRFHEAGLNGVEEVEVWGTGRPRREFLYIDDAADALVCLMERYSGEEIVNVAGGEDVSIAELAELAASTVGYSGRVRFDASRPDGMPRKALDATQMAAMGWYPRTPLKTGLRQAYDWYRGVLGHGN
jgi:GDP-L-fucose synthase